MALHADRQKLVLEQLSSEYKILQDKIDKIGAFRFTIKGWSVTIVVAAVVAVAANRQVPAEILFILLAFVCLFAWVEYTHVRLSDCFGQRAFQLESSVRYLLRVDHERDPAWRHVGMTPRIARHLKDFRRVRGGWPRLKLTIRWVFDADKAFYVLQVIGILVAYWMIHDRQSEPILQTPAHTVESDRGLFRR
jgi:hypothetical protein